jgi:hypothetical protein
MNPGTISISWGRWGGFYRCNGEAVKRLCIGWFELTWLALEIDDVLEVYANVPDHSPSLQAVTEEMAGIGIGERRN